MKHRTAIPIIRLRRNLLVSIQIELSDQLVDRLKADVSQLIRESEVHGLVIEVSGVDVFDSYIARSIRDLARIAHLLGVTTVLAGLDPGMAMTLVEMGMYMDGVHTALDLSDALAWLESAEQEWTRLSVELLDELDAPSPSAAAARDD
jgi:rsbT antagonist protein RsbS